MKRVRLVVCGVLSFGAAVAMADSPHFVGNVTAKLSDDAVQVCFKEAGLGTNQLIDYTASGNGTATYVCVNGGGQCPNANNKITVNGPVSATGTFSSGKNGSVSQCITIEPPSAGTFTCPSGQTLTLSSVSYTGLQIKDDTNGVTAPATPSSLSATPFTCP
jgi:hypothetical protein